MAWNHNLQKNLANWWSIQINKVQHDQLVLSSSRALSLSQHFWEETSWDEGRRFQFPGGGLEKLDGVFWGCRSVLLCKVCMFLSLDWMAGHDPGFSNSLCIQNSSLCIPRCVSSTQSHACKLHCWKTWYDGATWSWSRWCSRRTSLPPPARPSCYIYRVFF